jgi:hypothetical protein
VQPLKRRVFFRLSIAAGNALQLGGLLAGGWALAFAWSVRSNTVAVSLMLLGWVLLYLSCHGIAHWFVGRILGIRFLHYTVGGAAKQWPEGLRWIFEHLPFFGVQTEKTSMQNANPMAKAMMWSAGVTSSAVVPTLGAFWAWHTGAAHGKVLFLFGVVWSIGALVSNWTSPAGDYSKARRALGSN